MSRTYLYQTLKQDATAVSSGTLGAIGLKPEHLYAAGVETPEGDLFMTIRFGPMSRGIASVNKTEVVVWAYSRDRDYLNIERMLKRVRDLFLGIESQKTAEGWITKIEWAGESDDLADDVFRASTRNTTFIVVDSGR